MTKRTCIVCGSRFNAFYNIYKKTCGKECSALWCKERRRLYKREYRRKHGRPKGAADQESRTCIICSAPFSAKAYANTKTCSRTCSETNKRRYMRRYMHGNKESNAAAAASWRKRNPGYQREYYRVHRERILTAAAERCRKQRLAYLSIQQILTKENEGAH